MNNLLKRRTNWKKVCIILTLLVGIICLSVGFLLGKVNATDLEKYKIYNVDGTFTWKQAQPYIPTKLNNDNNTLITAIPTLTDGSSNIIFGYSEPLSYYNLNIVYSSQVSGIATFTIAYDYNGITLYRQLSLPINIGNNSLTIPNWMVKSNIQPLNIRCSNIACVG